MGDVRHEEAEQAGSQELCKHESKTWQAAQGFDVVEHAWRMKKTDFAEVPCSVPVACHPDCDCVHASARAELWCHSSEGQVCRHQALHHCVRPSAMHTNLICARTIMEP